MCLTIYKEQDSMRVPIMIKKEMFFWLEAKVVNNLKPQKILAGIHLQNTVKCFVTSEDGEGVRLHFLDCTRERDIELECEHSDYSTVFNKLNLKSNQDLIY
jgi:hypothetical protein